jgi:hypothetical protein
MQHSSTRPGQPDPAFDAELAAYNLAFSELGLEWHWDAATYDQIRRAAGDRPCVQAYIEAQCPHLLQAYDSGFLVEAIESVRGRRSEARAR